MSILRTLCGVLVGLLGIVGGTLYAIYRLEMTAPSILLLTLGAGLILWQMIRPLIPAGKSRPVMGEKPAPHAPYAWYGPFEVKTGPGPRDWRPPADG